jgi:predicted nucleic acid-binding protein
MKVVSNTSPIIFLRHAGCLGLLSSCFGKISIPKAVAAELGMEQLPPTVEILKISAEGQSFVEQHHGALHRGELEAMQLARETDADLVLLDDLLARNKAKALHLDVIGTLGVFLLACRRRHISPNLAAQKIALLISDHDMYVAPSLLRKINDELQSLE